MVHTHLKCLFAWLCDLNDGKFRVRFPASGMLFELTFFLSSAVLQPMEKSSIDYQIKFVDLI
jgi:hypothetical protein